MLLDDAFNAQRVAIVGVSSNREKWSNIAFRRLINGPFKGEVIPGSVVMPALTVTDVSSLQQENGR